MLNSIISWLIPTLLTGMMGYIAKELKENKKCNKATKNSIILILRSQIVGKCEKAIEIGFLSDYTRHCIDDLFNEYELLGGNHGVKGLVEQTFSLPPKSHSMNNKEEKRWKNG